MVSTSLTSTTGAQFNPAITSKKYIDIREANLGFAGTASTKYRDDAGVGTTIKWVTITAFAAAAKTEGNDAPITFTANTESAVTLTINQHQYAAFDLEEREAALSIVDQQTIYAARSAYAVNKAIDTTMGALVAGITNTTGTLTQDITDDDVRRSIQYLDDADVPAEDRFFAMSPATKNSMLSIDRYASSDFVSGGGTDLVKGSVGTIFGLKAWNSTNLAGSNSAGHDNCIYHRDLYALGMRRTPHVRQFSAVTTLSDQYSVSALWGTIRTRVDHGVYVKGA